MATIDQGGNSFGTDMNIGTIDPFAVKIKTNGNNRVSVDMNGNVGIGISTPMQFNASAILFPSIVPKMEISTGVESNTAFKEVVVIRHAYHDVNAVSRNVGIVFKLSTEADVGESAKAGAIMLGSAKNYANNPDMNFYIGGDSNPKMQILNTGTVKISSLAGTGTRIATADSSGNLATIPNNFLIVETDPVYTASIPRQLMVKNGSIGALQDLNTYQTTGLYIQDTNVNAASGTNYPVATAGVLEVVAAGLFVWQKYHTYQGVNSNRLYTRSYYNSTWSPWKLLIDANSITGTLNRTTVTNGVVDIDPAYVGQTSLTTLGTINVGTWNGSTIDVGYGGTGLTSAGISGNVLTSNGSTWVSSAPAIVDQWTDASGYGYLSSNSPNLGAGKGLDSRGGYASNCQELITPFGGVDDNVEFVYRVDPTNSDWTLYLPDPSLFRKRVLNITNFSTDTGAGIILADFPPINTENGITVDYLSPVKGDPTLPQWIQIMSIYTTVNSIPGYYWMVIKAGRKQNF